MPRKPIILLGIDGVLNPVARADAEAPISDPVAGQDGNVGLRGLGLSRVD
ncbi:hypothetical protein [Arthrobacter oryzae]|nr:hypothetical protein [Arthrobacter oryzae]WLQ04779.1 hypothetical protein Q8Z05_11445 [Arthrobacter oryzae]